MRQGNQWNWLLGVTVGLTLTAISSPGTLAQTASLLPNAVQYFMDGNGKPLANGKVFFYEPGGTTPKTTWTTANESVPQANPVVLGSSGRPTNPIYGDGSYRQIVKDQFNNVIWDFNTASAGGGSTAPAFSEGVMVGTLVYWANTVLPGKYLYAAGQAISRVTYPALFTALTWNTTVLCLTGVATISVSTEISDKVPIGAPVEFSCFTPGTTVSSKVSGQLTLSTNATTTTSATGVIFPWGNGDGSTTFNVPDMRGRAPLGRDNMNGSPISRLVASVYGSNPDAMNAAGGSLSTSLGLNQVPQGITGTGAVTGTFTSSSNFIKETGGTGSAGGGGALLATVVTGSITGTASITSDNTGKGQAASATVGAGGAGYSAGTQIISVAGGTCSVVPQFSVTVVAGAITAPVLTTAGQCTVVPANPAATTGGGGTGGTLNVTYAPLPLGTIPPSITSDWIVKALPDDTPGGTGVTSLGGMTGAIACGTGITCTANTVSISASTTGPVGTLYTGTGIGNPPQFQALAQIGATVKRPKFLRHVNISTVFSLAFDSDATLVDIMLVGAGGGGTGNGGNNFIPYSQYGDIGTPTAFDASQILVSISNAAPGIVTTPTHGTAWECNRPFYFSDNGDTLPAPLAFNTVYIIYCGDDPLGSNTNAPTATTFGVSTRSYSTPITCVLYAPNCQTAITTTTAGSGTHILNMYTFVATAGSGGGVVGDGGLPGTNYGCDAPLAQGHVGSVGSNFYGINIAPGIGGAGIFGGGGTNGAVGTDLTGGGGSGAFPTATASGGGGGGGGGPCHIIFKPTAGHFYPLLCGVAGNGGVAAVQAATFTNASPTVVTMTGSRFPPNAAVVFTGGSLPTGVTAGVTYYTLPLDDVGDTYNILTSPYTTAINTSSAGSGTVTSGTAGSRGAYGACEIWQYYGLE